MADSLDTLLTTLTNLQREGGSAIQLYRARYASPEDVESVRFWVQNELDKIQAGFSSADEVVTILAKGLQQVIGALDLSPADGSSGSPLQGPEGPQGPPGPEGPPGSGRQVYQQLDQPVGASEGDIWLQTRT